MFPAALPGLLEVSAASSTNLGRYSTVMMALSEGILHGSGSSSGSQRRVLCTVSGRLGILCKSRKKKNRNEFLVNKSCSFYWGKSPFDQGREEKSVHIMYSVGTVGTEGYIFTIYRDE